MFLYMFKNKMLYIVVALFIINDTRSFFKNKEAEIERFKGIVRESSQNPELVELEKMVRNACHNNLKASLYNASLRDQHEFGELFLNFLNNEQCEDLCDLLGDASLVNRLKTLDNDVVQKIMIFIEKKVRNNDFFDVALFVGNDFLKDPIIRLLGSKDLIHKTLPMLIRLSKYMNQEQRIQVFFSILSVVSDDTVDMLHDFLSHTTLFDVTPNNNFFVTFSQLIAPMIDKKDCITVLSTLTKVTAFSSVVEKLLRQRLLEIAEKKGFDQYDEQWLCDRLSITNLTNDGKADIDFYNRMLSKTYLLHRSQLLEICYNRLKRLVSKSNFDTVKWILKNGNQEMMKVALTHVDNITRSKAMKYVFTIGSSEQIGFCLTFLTEQGFLGSEEELEKYFSGIILRQEVLNAVFDTDALSAHNSLRNELKKLAVKVFWDRFLKSDTAAADTLVHDFFCNKKVFDFTKNVDLKNVTVNSVLDRFKSRDKFNLSNVAFDSVLDSFKPNYKNEHLVVFFNHYRTGLYTLKQSEFLSLVVDDTKTECVNLLLQKDISVDRYIQDPQAVTSDQWFGLLKILIEFKGHFSIVKKWLFSGIFKHCNLSDEHLNSLNTLLKDSSVEFILSFQFNDELLKRIFKKRFMLSHALEKLSEVIDVMGGLAGVHKDEVLDDVVRTVLEQRIDDVISISSRLGEMKKIVDHCIDKTIFWEIVFKNADKDNAVLTSTLKSFFRESYVQYVIQNMSKETVLLHVDRLVKEKLSDSERAFFLSQIGKYSHDSTGINEQFISRYPLLKEVPDDVFNTFITAMRNQDTKKVVWSLTNAYRQFYLKGLLSKVVLSTDDLCYLYKVIIESDDRAKIFWLNELLIQYPIATLCTDKNHGDFFKPLVGKLFSVVIDYHKNSGSCSLEGFQGVAKHFYSMIESTRSDIIDVKNKIGESQVADNKKSVLQTLKDVQSFDQKH